jgi:hypothetical protein
MAPDLTDRITLVPAGDPLERHLNLVGATARE